MKHKAKISGLILIVWLYAGFGNVAYSMTSDPVQEKCKAMCPSCKGSVSAERLVKQTNPSSGGGNTTQVSGSATCTCNVK